jgi:hypothetical protein
MFFVSLVRHQEKLKVKEILGNSVDQFVRLFDFFPDFADFVGEISNNPIGVVIFWTEVAQDEENFFFGFFAV